MTISGAALGLKAALQRVSELVSSVSEASPLAGAALLLSARNPEELTSDLLDVCESLDLEGSPEPPVGLSLACAAAALQLQERKGVDRAGLERLLAVLLLPLLRSKSPQAADARAQVGHTIVRLLTEAGAWDLAALLVCQAAVALDSLPWNGTRPFEAISLDSLLGDVTLRINVRHLLASSSGLPLPACCHLLRSLLPPGSDGQLSGEEAQHIFRRVSNGNLILRCLDLLDTKDKKACQMVLQMVLPPVVAQCCASQSHQCRGIQSEAPLADAAWSACRRMLLDKSGTKRLTGLAALMQLLPLLPLDEARSGAWSGSDKEGPGFWGILRACLVDCDPLVRKRALLITQRAVGSAWQAAHWAAFDSLVNGLEEFAVHLVHPSFVHMDLIHPRKAEGNCGGKGSAATDQVWGYEWVEVVWRLGLTHKNPQVCRMTAKLLFERDCSFAWSSLVANEFVVDVLIPSVEAPVHHKEEAAQGTSRAMRQLADFVGNHVASRPALQEAHTSVLLLLQSLAARGYSRTGLPVALAAAVAAATALKAYRQKQQEDGGGQLAPDGWMDLSLAALADVAAGVGQHPGPAFQLRQLQSVLEAAHAATWLPTESARYISDRFCTQAAAQLLEKLPLSELAEGKKLADPADTWLMPLPGDGKLREWLAAGIRQMLSGFLGASQPAGDKGLSFPRVQDMDLQARQIARLMLQACRVATEPALGLLAAVEQQVHAVCQRTYLDPCALERAFLLLRALLQPDSGSNGGITVADSLLCGLAVAVAPDVAAAVTSYAYVYWKGVDSKSPGRLPSGLPELSPEAWKLEHRAFLCLETAGMCRIWAASKGRSPQATLASRSLQQGLEKWLDHLGTHPVPTAVHGETWPTLQLAALEAAHVVCHGLGLGVKSSSFLTGTTAPHALCGVRREMTARKGELARLGLQPEPPALCWKYIEACFALSPSPQDDIPVGLVEPSTQAEWMMEAAAAMPGASERSAVPLLRVLRRLLTSAVLREEVCVAWAKASGIDVSKGSRISAISAALKHVASAVLEMLRRQKRRRVGINAAAAVCLLPAAVFDCRNDAKILALHEPGGAVHWTVEQLLLEAGRKSGGLSHAVALQLGGLCAAHPECAACYSASFGRLLLEGSLDPDLEGIAGWSEPVPPGSEEEGFLQVPLDTELETTYALTAMGPRVTSLCFLRHLAARSGILGPGPGTDECRHAYVHPDEQAAGRDAGHAIWAELLATSKDPQMTSGQYKQGGSLHRRKVRLWQALCCASAFVGGAAEAQEALDHVLSSLREFNMANVRQYQEALAVVLIRRSPKELLRRLLSELDAYEHRNEGLASYVLIAAEVILDCQEEASRMQLFHQVFPVILPWALNHNHNLRTFTQVVLKRIFETYPELPSRSPSQMGSSDNAMTDKDGIVTAAAVSSLGGLNSFLSTNHDMLRLYQALSPSLLAFNASDAANPRVLLRKDVQLIGPANNVLNVFEGAPMPLIDEVSNFLNAERQVRRTMHHERLAACHQEEGLVASSETAGVGSHHAKQDAPAPLQRKFAPVTGAERWAGGEHDDIAALAALGLGDAGINCAGAAGSTGSGEDEGRAAALSGGRQKIIVVASLIDKVPNLAGLARTCEVFRASSLVVHDAKVMKDPSFINISVSAEKWIPMEVVSEQSLRSYLEAKILDGYHLIGLEQTSESVSLPDFDFPAKSVLVLGREREGVPAELLGMLHACVEIPQLGVIRSLNVHVSGAIAMYEYTCQQRRRFTTSLANSAV